MKGFSSYQLLQAWLETQIGAAKGLRPTGYEMPGEKFSTWKDTCARAKAIMEGLPMYDMLRVQLIEWACRGLSDDKAFGLVSDFMESLDAHLLEYPFYASEEPEEGSKTPVVWLNVEEAAKKIGVGRTCLLNRLNRRKTALPYGSYKHERKWNIHPLDVEVLREKEVA